MSRDEPKRQTKNTYDAICVRNEEKKENWIYTNINKHLRMLALEIVPVWDGQGYSGGQSTETSHPLLFCPVNSELPEGFTYFK